MASLPSKTITFNEFNNRQTTYFKRNKYAYKWTIHSFSDWLQEEGNQRQYSEVFPVDPNTEHQWKLEIIFSENATSQKNVGKTGKESYFSLYLYLEKAPQATVNTKYELCFKNSNDLKIAVFSSKIVFKEKGGWGKANIISRNKLFEAITNDVLIISCEIEANTKLITETESVTIEQFVPRNYLSNDMASLVEGEKFGDVTIIVGSRQFLVYKGILAARSSVFAAMFDHKMVENIQDTVHITDIEEAVFKELLRYIYTDKVDNLDSLSYQLFAAADKYHILPLKALCQHAILANLSVSNAAKTLQLADMHQAPEIKARVLEFLSSSASRGVTETIGWEMMASTHPHLVNEAYKAIDLVKPTF